MPIGIGKIVIKFTEQECAMMRKAKRRQKLFLGGFAGAMVLGAVTAVTAIGSNQISKDKAQVAKYVSAERLDVLTDSINNAHTLNLSKSSAWQNVLKELKTNAAIDSIKNVGAKEFEQGLRVIR